MSLTDYQTDTYALLHDYGGNFTPQAQLNRWINLGRRACARRTGCIMRVITGQSAFGAGAQAGSMIPGALQPGALPGSFPNAQQAATQNAFTTIVGAERYPFVGFANQFLKDSHAGVDSVIDVASISVSWGQSPRPTLVWMPWEDLQAYARSYSVLTTSYPTFWSVHNDGTQGEVWLYPAPSQANEMEWNVYCEPSDLYANDDFDTIPKGFRNAIKWYAAGMAFHGSYRHLQAATMMAMFEDSIGVGRVASDHGKIPNAYWSAFD